MSTINTGKFNWYIGSSADKVDLNGHPDVAIRSIPISSPDSPQLLKTIPQTTSSVLPSPLPIVQQPLNTEFQEDVLPLNDSLDIKPTPTEPSRIFDEVTQAVSPLVDRISRNLSPKEPSRIRRDVNTSFVPSHVAHKHSLVSPISSPSSHIKRQKLPMSEFNSDPLHLNDCDFNDYNTVSGSDSVDFWFSQRVPSDIISLEEGERKFRMTHGVDSVLLGKIHRVQKEYMSRVRPLVPVSMIKSNVDSISHMKDELIEKSSELMNSAKDAFTMGSISSTLKEIAEESTSSTQDGELVSFFWPAQVPSDVSSAMEKARSEWMEMHIEPYFKSQWKHVHASLLQKFNAPSSLMARTVGSVIQITSKFGLGAIDLALDALHLGVKDLSGLESVRMLEEQERSRRMAIKTVDPILDIKKSLVERELLSSLKFSPMM